jgi:hypothetical protein
MSLMSDPTWLPIHCAYCHGPVTVRFEEWGREAPKQTIWICPHCEVVNTDAFPGRPASVTKGHKEVLPD